MRRAWFVTALLFLVAACGGDDDHGKKHDEDGDTHGAHAGKHGGEVTVLGDEEGHVEVLHDEAAGKVSVWTSDGSMADVSLAAPPVLNLVTDSGPKQITGQGAGNAWTFTDEALKGEPRSARLRLVIGGKTYSPELEHAHNEEE